jgi:hypothetical protein
VYRIRSQVIQFGEQSEVKKLQDELRATAEQLDSIRRELGGGFNIFQPGPLAKKALNMTNTLKTPLRFENKQQEIKEHSHTHPQPQSPPTFLPISASAAGLVPDRTKSAPSGSEILSDALQEEHVAHSATAYFRPLLNDKR